MKAALKSEFVIFGTFMPAFAVILVLFLPLWRSP